MSSGGWSTENELKNISEGSLFHSAKSELLTFLFYLIYIFLSFYPTEPLGIYYGTQFRAFMGFLSVLMSVSLQLNLVFVGLCSFCFVLAQFVSFRFVLFILFYYYPLEGHLFSFKLINFLNF